VLLVIALVFACVGVFLLVGSDRHFRAGRRNLRVIGATASFIAAAACVLNFVID
jgi:drug/metabolite transporter (DMT)-like permease